MVLPGLTTDCFPCPLTTPSAIFPLFPFLCIALPVFYFLLFLIILLLFQSHRLFLSPASSLISPPYFFSSFSYFLLFIPYLSPLCFPLLSSSLSLLLSIVFLLLMFVLHPITLVSPLSSPFFSSLTSFHFPLFPSVPFLPYFSL